MTNRAALSYLIMFVLDLAQCSVYFMNQFAHILLFYSIENNGYTNAANLFFTSRELSRLLLDKSSSMLPVRYFGQCRKSVTRQIMLPWVTVTNFHRKLHVCILELKLWTLFLFMVLIQIP